MKETQEEIVKRWEAAAKKLLYGRRVGAVRYMTDAEMEQHGWSSKALIISLVGKDKTSVNIYASADDEGNDAGAYFTTDEELPVIPVI